MTTPEKTLLQKIASSLRAYKNCLESDNKEWEIRHMESIDGYIDQLPHGSGIDGQTSINLEKSDGKQTIILESEYHYMDQYGGYAGWFYFQLEITANLDGYPDYDFCITRNDTDETLSYLHDMLLNRNLWLYPLPNTHRINHQPTKPTNQTAVTSRGFFIQTVIKIIVKL
jgi:hypothetical protein